MGYRHRWLAALLFAASATSVQAQEFRFDFEQARLVSKAVRSGEFDPANVSAIEALPESAAIVRKLRMKDMSAMLPYLRKLHENPKMVAAAEAAMAEFAQPDGGKYGPLAAEITRQLKQYVPADFNAKLTVHFIFGSNSGGFAFDDVPNDVYVNVARLSQASTLEVAEMVEHELFHAVQSNVMKPPPRPAPDAAAAGTGAIWLNRLLYDLEQEGTAELFSHPLADRAATTYSAADKTRIERNATRIGNIVKLYETLGWRLYHQPPADENIYDGIYGLMFYTDFDATAYDLGWLMASTIEKTDGKAGVYALLKKEPKQFVLRYQALATADGKLPTFSDDFIKKISSL